VEVRYEKKEMYFLWFLKHKKTRQNKKNRNFFKGRILKSSLNDFIVKTVGGLLHLGEGKGLHTPMIYLLK
jgi:hypothetical protein